MNIFQTIKNGSSLTWLKRYFSFFPASVHHSYQPEQGIKHRCVLIASLKIFLVNTISLYALISNRFDQLFYIPKYRQADDNWCFI